MARVVVWAGFLAAFCAVAAGAAGAEAHVIEGEIQPLPEHVLVLKKLVKMLVFCAAGLFVLFLGFRAFEAVAPFGLRKEVGEEKNTAVALVFAAVALALGAVIHGALTVL